jgi:hypothetical protein
MPTATKKKPTANKKPATGKTIRGRGISGWLSGQLTAFGWHIQDFKSRRPHRSFRLTRRRDYARSLQLPGYWAFSNYVFRTLWEKKRLFGLLTLVYAVLSGLVVGTASQDIYTQLGDTLKETSGDIFEGNMGEIGKAGLLLAATISGGANATPTEGQQIYGAIFILLTWLTTVWLLRNILAGHAVRLRDGLYNAGAPIVATFFVGIVLLVQLLPLGLAFLGYSAAVSSGLLSGGVAAMVFWMVASLLAVLSLYWVTSTIIALVVVTLPGMYPVRALRVAGDLVIGRRLRILFRLLWMLLGIVVSWAVIMIPIVIFDTWLKGIWPAIASFPTIPLALLAASSVTVVWAASYVYLLYRKVVDDDALPA